MAYMLDIGQCVCVLVCVCVCVCVLVSLCEHGRWTCILMDPGISFRLDLIILEQYIYVKIYVL